MNRFCSSGLQTIAMAANHIRSDGAIQRQRRLDRDRPPLRHDRRPLTGHILQEGARRKAKWGVVTMCIGGGQGGAGLFEIYS